MVVVARAARIRRRFEEAQDVWYCVEYAATAPPSHNPLQDKDIKGLVLQHWVERNASSSSRLLSYWSNRSKFVDSRDVFERRLGLGGPLAEGYVRQFTIQRSPLWWRTLRLGLKTITAATALFGAWTAVTALLGPWWAHPDVDVSLDIPKRGIEGEEFEGAVTITNHGEYKVKVDLSPLAWTPQTDARVNAPGWTGSVPKDDERAIPIAGVFPPRGVYTLGGEREAGSLRTDRKPVGLTVRVWPKETHIERHLATESPATRAIVTGKIEVGPEAPKGLRCYFKVNGPVRFDPRTPVVFDGIDGRPSAGVGPPRGKPVAYLRWCTEPFAEYSEPRFKIVMVAETPVDWQGVVAGADFKCRIRREDPC